MILADGGGAAGEFAASGGGKMVDVPADKPRHLQSSRDLVLSIVPLVLISLALAGVSRACAFSPGGPSSAPPPTIDVTRVLADDARLLSFPIRQPQLPDGWVANSSSNVTVGGTAGGTSARVGYVTPGGAYLRLAQSNAAADVLLAAEVPGLRTRTGAKQVGGGTWQLYAQQGSEPAWVSDQGSVRLLITGSGSDRQFSELAGAVLAGAPLQG